MPGGAVFHQVLYNNALTALLGLRGTLDRITDPDSATFWAKAFGDYMVSPPILKDSSLLILRRRASSRMGKRREKNPLITTM
jgi:hypothetical protein